MVDAFEGCWFQLSFSDPIATVRHETNVSVELQFCEVVSGASSSCIRDDIITFPNGTSVTDKVCSGEISTT
jgi:hypothetical protein